MSFTPEQTGELNKPLSPDAVRKAPQGKYGEYVDAYHVICEANRIFGHDGWSYTITSMQPCCRVEAADKNGNAQIRVAYRCTVLAEAGGVSREGAAVGTGMSKPENEGDAHESAVKEAETDALKRALRSFGNTFGLALYDKTKANVSAPPPELITEDQRTELMALCEANGVVVGEFLKVGNISDLREVPAAEFVNARKWILANAKQKENA